VAIYLDAVTECNGPTLVVPGTHTLPHPEFDRAVHPKQTAVLGPAGSVALFFATVWHRGAANTTNQPRRALFCYYRAPDAIRVRRTPDPTAGTGWVLGDAGVLSAHWSE
jgi:ectoine hydroxylase-related dioxygenase (phytanoyl-CoA dioxygenase family)